MQASHTLNTDPAPDALSIHRVPAGRGLAWLASGWADFRRNMAPLAVLSITLLLVSWLLVGSKGGFISVIISIIYLGAAAAYCRMGDRGEVFLAGSGTWRNPALWALAVVAGMASVAMVGVVALAAVAGFSTGVRPGAPVGLGWFYFFGAAQVLITLLVSTIWMAPALVVNKGAGVVQALRLSIVGSLRNPLAFLTVLVLGFVLVVVASIPLGLGLVVALPMLACAAARAADEIVA